MEKVKVQQFQSDYQASLELSRAIRAGFPVSHPQAKSAPKHMPSRHNLSTRLGCSLPMLTKGGSSVEEMGVDFWGRKGELVQMALLSILRPPEEFWGVGPGQGAEIEEQRASIDVPFTGEKKAA